MRTEETGRTAARARISLSAVKHNAAAVAGSGLVADLRRDAWGHGVSAVAGALAEGGVTAAAVDPAGVAAAREAGLRVVDDGARIDPAHLWGYPGSGGIPVLQLVGTVLSRKPLRAGEGVSYGLTHRATRDTTVALVTGGYAQGVVRALGNRASVELGGRLCPIVGRVAMDVCVVDVGGAEGDDEAVFFGGTGRNRDAIADWAAATGMTPAELVCAVGLRARREVLP